MTEGRPPRQSILASAVSRALGTALLLLIVPGAVIGGYWFYGERQEREIAALEAKIEAQREAFEGEIANLLGEERRAQFRLLKQEIRDGTTWNTIRFIEFFKGRPVPAPGSDAESAELESPPTAEEVAFERTFELPGREVYIDAFSVKFAGDAVRRGRARNFSVFRRAFSNTIEPDEGVLLYEGTLAEAGRLAARSIELERPSDSQRYLRALNHYLKNPDDAEADGLRVIEGQANYTVPRMGFYYELVQQASGGLTIAERPIPAILAEGDRGADPPNIGTKTPQNRPKNAPN